MFWQGGSPAEIGSTAAETLQYVLNLYPGQLRRPHGTEIRVLKVADGSRTPDDSVSKISPHGSMKPASRTDARSLSGRTQRSALVAGLVLMRSYDMTADDAIAMLRKRAIARRPVQPGVRGVAQEAMRPNSWHGRTTGSSGSPASRRQGTTCTHGTRAIRPSTRSPGSRRTQTLVTMLTRRRGRHCGDPRPDRRSATSTT